MNIEEIKNLPTVYENISESIFKSFHVLDKVKTMLQRNDSKETILEMIDLLYSKNDFLPQQEDWLNPNSPKYYKGYRYEKDEYWYAEEWSVENGNIRKAIGYWDNGNKYYEGYYNENGDRHNEDGYAYQEWGENGDILLQEYYLNGEVVNEQEWKEKTGKIESTQHDYLNPDSPKYYKGYRYEKNKYGNDCWYDENNVRRKEIDYHYNGNKYYECYYDEKGDYHNEEGYAYQYWNRNGDIKIQEYWLNGKEISEEDWKEKTGRK